mgnify:CR=1 FL=1
MKTNLSIEVFGTYLRDIKEKMFLSLTASINRFKITIQASFRLVVYSTDVLLHMLENAKAIEYRTKRLRLTF